MKITPSRINTLLTIGENLNIEFKRAGDGPKADTFESVCAFLNKAGGDLLLGVDDDGTVVGLPPKSVDAMIRYGRITPKNLEPEPKNPIIANFFHQIRLADELGSGVRNLYHYVKIYSNAEPVFDEDDVFRLTVPLDDAYSADRALTEGLPQTTTAQESAAKASGVNDGVNEKVNERQRSIISSVSSNPYITQVELATMLGISIVHVNKNMKKLQALGIIRRVGPDKGGHWEVIG